MRTNQAMMPRRLNNPLHLPQKLSGGLRGLGAPFNFSNTYQAANNPKSAGGNMSVTTPGFTAAPALAPARSAPVTSAPITAAPRIVAPSPGVQIQPSGGAARSAASGTASSNAPYNFSQSAFGDNPNYVPAVDYTNFSRAPSATPSKPNYLLWGLLAFAAALIIKKA